MKRYCFECELIFLLIFCGILQSCGASRNPIFSFASFPGKQLSEVFNIMNEWGFDTIVRQNALQVIYFRTQLPGAKDTCILGIWYSHKTDTVVEVLCTKITKPSEEFRFANPAPVNISDFRRWDSLLTLQYGPYSDSEQDGDTYLYWKGIHDICLDYQPLKIRHRDDTVRSILLFRSYWKGGKKDGHHY